MITIEIQKYGNDERRIIFVDNDDFAKGIYDEEGNFIVAENGEYKAFYSDDEWHSELDFDIFNEIKDYKELDREVDYYGTGYDRIKAVIDGEEAYLSASRWTSGIVEKGYRFVGWV